MRSYIESHLRSVLQCGYGSPQLVTANSHADITSHRIVFYFEVRLSDVHRFQHCRCDIDKCSVVDFFQVLRIYSDVLNEEEWITICPYGRQQVRLVTDAIRGREKAIGGLVLVLARVDV